MELFLFWSCGYVTLKGLLFIIIFSKCTGFIEALILHSV